MISFVIPTLNEEKYIGKTLEYLSKYSGPKEIIVSDRNSPDRTVEIARQYADTVLVNDPKDRRLTIGIQRNLGAAIAKGEFLVFIDAEICVLDADIFFARALKVFADDPQLVGVTGVLKVFPEMETIGDRIMIPFFVWWRILFNRIGIGAATGEFQMMRTEVFRAIGGFDERLVAGEDDDLFRRLAKIGKTRLVRKLVGYHPNRRARVYGWPKLIYVWTKETLGALFFKKSASKEWTQVR